MTNFLDPLIYGYRRVYNATGDLMPRRRKLKFLGASFADDEEGDTTVVNLTGEVSVPGDTGDLLLNVSDELAATAKLRLENSEIAHYGKPRHNETWADFYAGGDSFARTQWHDTDSVSDEEVTIGQISIPAEDHGDGILTVIFEASLSYDDSGIKGGNRAFKAAFRRNGGTLTRIGIENTSSGALWTGDPIGGLDADVFDNDTIELTMVGIEDIPINVIPSVHVIMSKPPA